MTEMINQEEIDDEKEEEVKEEDDKEIEENKEEDKKEEDKGEQITSDELLSLKEKAKKYDDLVPEFTRKSQILAEIEKKRDEGKEIETKKDLDSLVKELSEKEGWSEDEIRASAKLITKILPAMGYVPKEELEKTNYEREKQKQTDAFISKYPEFNKSNDPNDEKWNLLMREFNLYRLPNDVNQIGNLLEKAKNAAFGEKKDDGENKAMVRVIKNKQAGAGAGGRSGGAPVSKDKEHLADKYRKMGWSEEDIKSVL